MVNEQATITTLILQLGNYSKEERESAAKALEALGEGRLANVVLDVIDGDGKNGQEVLLDLVAETGDRRAGTPLLECIADGRNPLEVRKRACEALGKMGDRRAVELLTRRTEYQPGLLWDDESIAEVCNALIQLGGQDVIKSIIDYLEFSYNNWLPHNKSYHDSYDKKVIRSFNIVCDTLGQFGDEALEMLLDRAISRKFNLNRGVEFIRKIFGEKAVDTLILRLGEYQETAYAGGILNLLEKDKIEVEKDKIKVAMLEQNRKKYANSCSPEAVKALQEVWKQVDTRVEKGNIVDIVERVRQYGKKDAEGDGTEAANALQELFVLMEQGDTRVVLPFIRQLEVINFRCPFYLDYKESIAQKIREIITVYIDKYPEKKRLIQLLTCVDEQLCQKACIALGGLCNPDVIEPLLERLGDPVADVRQAAYDAIVRLTEHDPQTRELAHGLHDLFNEDSAVSSQAVNVLEKFAKAGDTRTVKPLVEYSLRQEMLLPQLYQALSLFSDEVIIHLKEYLKYRSDDEKFYQILGKLKNRRAIELLYRELMWRAGYDRLIGGECFWYEHGWAALKKLEEEDSIQLIFDTFDQNPEKRKTARERLKVLGDNRVVRYTLYYLEGLSYGQEGFGRIRNRAIETLEYFEEKLLINALYFKTNALISLIQEKDFLIVKLLKSWAKRYSHNKDSEPSFSEDEWRQYQEYRDPNREDLIQAIHVVFEEMEPKLNEWFCPQCLMRTEIAMIELEHRHQGETYESAKFIQCHKCKASETLIEVKQVVCVLDQNDTQTDEQPINGILRVNWFKRKKLFDFDKVEIRHADEPQVRAFLNLIKNDADSFRKHYYKRMNCIIYIQDSSIIELVRKQYLFRTATTV